MPNSFNKVPGVYVYITSIYLVVLHIPNGRDALIGAMNYGYHLGDLLVIY